MLRSHFRMLKLDRSWAAKYVGAADSFTLDSHSATHTKPYFAGSAVPPIRRNR